MNSEADLVPTLLEFGEVEFQSVEGGAWFRRAGLFPGQLHRPGPTREAEEATDPVEHAPTFAFHGYLEAQTLLSEATF